MARKTPSEEQRPRENAVTRLVELGVKEGLLVKSRLECDTNEKLDLLLACIDAAFADYNGEVGFTIEDFCICLLVGNGAFDPPADYTDFEEDMKNYLRGLEQGRYLATCKLAGDGARFYPPPCRHTQFELGDEDNGGREDD